MYNNLMFIAGLTGNYGMGKSAALQMFRELGAVTIDADWVVQRLLREKPVLKKIEALFGAGVFDKKGSLNKGKIAQRIFRNKSLRIKLEDLLHPLVFEKIDDFFGKTKNGKKVFIIEAPLLFERGYEKRFDRIITVFTNQTTAINRLSMVGINAKTASERLKCQLPIKEKLKKSDYKIDNSGLPEETKKQIEAVYKKLVVDARIKELLLAGKVQDVKKIAGQHYFIEGKVIKGAGRGGKLLHTPTANLALEKASPLKEGVYAVKVTLNKKVYNGVANIGKNPTFGDMPMNYEVHIFNFSGNLLGKRLRIDFIKYMRDEKKFPNIKTLEAQIKKDIKKVREILRNE